MTNQSVYEVRPLKSHMSFTVEVPGSKSITNRALLLAAMGQGSCTLKGVLFSADSRAFLDCLDRLGFVMEISEEKKEVTIHGTGGEIPKKEASIHVGSAGTAARFLTVFLAFAGGDFFLDASEQMRRRPMEPLVKALRQAGVEIECTMEEYHFPFYLHSHGVDPQKMSINTDVSSQFASALMMAGGLLPSGLKLTLEGQRTNGSYIGITQRMLTQFGFSYEREGDEVRLCHEPVRQPDVYEIEPDVSAAAYFYAMSPICNKTICVKGVHLDSMQGDIQFINTLEGLGCRLNDGEEGLVVEPPAQGHYPGITLSMKDFSDQTMTMACVAVFADTPTCIRDIGHIRFQESDRLQAIVNELTRAGIQCEATEENNAIRIVPGTPKAAELATYEDHRMAMAFSLLGLRANGIRILNPGCCAKTFENYFEILDEMCII